MRNQTVTSIFVNRTEKFYEGKNKFLFCFTNEHYDGLAVAVECGILNHKWDKYSVHLNFSTPITEDELLQRVLRQIRCAWHQFSDRDTDIDTTQNENKIHRTKTMNSLLICLKDQNEWTSLRKWKKYIDLSQSLSTTQTNALDLDFSSESLCSIQNHETFTKLNYNKIYWSKVFQTFFNSSTIY